MKGEWGGGRRARGERASTVRVVEVREFGGPEVLRLADVPEPEAGPGEAVVGAVPLVRGNVSVIVTTSG